MNLSELSISGINDCMFQSTSMTIPSMRESNSTIANPFNAFVPGDGAVAFLLVSESYLRRYMRSSGCVYEIVDWTEVNNAARDYI